MTPRFSTALLVLFGTLAPASVHAQAPAEKWEFMFMPYFTAPHMNGTIGIGPATSDVDASPSDIFSALQFGIMGDFLASKGPWAFNLNGLYMDLAKDGENLPIRASADQGTVELTALRQLTPAFQVLAGGRINWIGASLDVNGSQKLDESQTWFDPFIGARVEIPNTGKWRVWARGDVGGFGIGSKFAWQTRVGVGYRASKLIEIAAAYWAVGMNYENSNATLPFTYDVTTFGPQLGIGFHF